MMDEDQSGEPAADPLALMCSWLPPNDDHSRPMMTLSTIDVDGYPDARSVLLSEADRDGLYFHTDSRSRKARQLTATGRACAVLAWPELGRQLVAQGDVTSVPAARSAAVFAVRGPYLRLLAWANTPETALLPAPERRARWAEFAHRHPDATLLPPPTWIGFRLRPRRLTFYRADEAGPSHRTEYRLLGGAWTAALLPG